MEFNELISPSLTDLFVKDIQTKILSNQLKVGERLPTERKMAEKMKVSRAVINGGISELERQGFLEVIPRKGTYVADYRNVGSLDTIQAILEYNGGQFDPDMVESIFQVRRCLESDIARLCALNRSTEDILALDRILNETETSEDINEQSEKGYMFYHRMAIASGNNIYPLLIHGFRHIYTATALVYFSISQEGGETTLPLLHKLLDSIKKQDSESAKACDLEIIKAGQIILAKHFSPGEQY